ncbi:MAG: TetR/AcrR family transcriptional regulator [Phycisphaerales bacterium]|nr:TetR/AcrR family transcriptional regulator [Phycisphaerales bacterium]
MANSPEHPPGTAAAQTRPRRTQRERREASRAAILSAARDAFIEHGFNAVSLEEIVKRAGLTRGALYHQFSDKAAVLRAVVEAEAAQMQGRLRTGLAGVDHPMERARLGFGVYLDSLDDPRVIRLMAVEFPAHCGLDRTALDSPWLRYTEALIEDAVSRGLLERVPVQAVARLIIAFSREAVLAIADADDPSATRREMEAALLALYRGLERRPSPR